MYKNVIQKVELGSGVTSIGDMKVNDNWTRNQDGEQITLDENATYDELVAHIAEIEAILKGKEADTNAAEE